jgi:hypothetical protein
MRFMSGMVVSGKDPQVPAGLKGAKDAEAGMGPGPGRIDGLGGFEGAVVIPAPSWLKEVRVHGAHRRPVTVLCAAQHVFT